MLRERQWLLRGFRRVDDAPAMARVRRKVVAIIGNNSAPQEVAEAAEAVGKGLVERGFRLVSGGLGGVMEAASRGAHAAATYREGDVIGLLPGKDAAAANPWVDVVVPTGLGYARNVLVVSMADVVVAIGGGAGTLTEIAMAWQLDKPIVALEVGGWSARLAGEKIDERARDAIVAARGAEEALLAVERLFGES